MKKSDILINVLLSNFNKEEYNRLVKMIRTNFTNTIFQCFTTKDELQDCLKTSSYDIIVINFSKPFFENSETVAQIKKSHIPIILIIQDDEDKFDMGSDHYAFISDFINVKYLNPLVIGNSIMLVLERMNYRDLFIETEERYKVIFEFSPKAFFMLNAKTKAIIDTNTAATKLLGYRKEELIGQSLYDYIIGDKTKLEGIKTIKCNNGGKLTLDINTRKINLHGDEALIILGNDIADDRIKDSRLRFLESVISNSTDSILITESNPIDEPGPIIVYVNKAFEKMTGYSFQEIKGKSPRILQGPKTQKIELKKLKEHLKINKPIEVELINYTKSGEEFWVNISIAPVPDSIQNITHFISIQRDVTKKRQQLSTLKKQNDQLSEIAWIQSHIVRAPLARIMGLVNLLTEKFEVDQHKIIKEIKNSSEELDQVIKNLVLKAETVESIQ